MIRPTSIVICVQPIVEANDGQYVDSTGRVTDHDALVSLDQLVEVLVVEAAS